MNSEYSNLVRSTINYGWNLKTRLLHGEQLILANEQATLKRLLLSDTESKRWADFGGEDAGPAVGRAGSYGAGDGHGGDGRFLGIRYALVCWLDELFAVDSPWEAEWNERKLELSLYGTNDRAWRFWEQAKIAEKRQGSDVLQVFYLCVMLGFRGDLSEQATRLGAWVEAARARLSKTQIREWPPPPRLEPRTDVPPLHGRKRMQRMVLTAGMVLLVFLPIVTALMVIQLSR